MARVAVEPTPSPGRVFLRSLRHLALRDAVAALLAAWRLAFEPRSSVSATTRASAAAVFLSVILFVGVGSAVVSTGALALLGPDGPAPPLTVPAASPSVAPVITPEPSPSPSPTPSLEPSPSPTPTATPKAPAAKPSAQDERERATPKPTRKPSRATDDDKEDERETPEPRERERESDDD